MGVFVILMLTMCVAFLGMVITALSIMISKGSCRYREEDDDHVFLFPVIPNEFIYEIIEDERYEPCVAKYKVTDVSVNGLEYDGVRVEWGHPNIFMTRKEAERELEKRLEANR